MKQKKCDRKKCDRKDCFANCKGGNGCRILLGEPDPFCSFFKTQKQFDEDLEKYPYCHEDADGYVTPIEKNCHVFIIDNNKLYI